MVVASPRSSPSPTMDEPSCQSMTAVSGLVNRQDVGRHARAAAQPRQVERHRQTRALLHQHDLEPPVVGRRRRAAAEGPRPAWAGTPERFRSTGRRRAARPPLTWSSSARSRGAPAVARTAAARRPPRDRPATRTRARSGARQCAAPGQPSHLERAARRRRPARQLSAHDAVDGEHIHLTRSARDDGLQRRLRSVGARPRLRQKSLPVPMRQRRQRDRARRRSR